MKTLREWEDETFSPEFNLGAAREYIKVQSAVIRRLEKKFDAVQRWRAMHQDWIIKQLGCVDYPKSSRCRTCDVFGELNEIFDAATEEQDE
jgi:hypothetical protein